MWTRSYSTVIKSIHKETIWDLWRDVNNWHEWMPHIEYCRLEKPFQTGSQFILKPAGASAVTVKLIDVKKNEQFTGRTRFFGATMYDTYEIHKNPQGVRLTVTLKVKGPLGFLWRMLVAQKIANNLPKLIKNLVSVAHASTLKEPMPDRQSQTSALKKSKLHLIASAPTKGKSLSKVATAKKLASKGANSVSKAAHTDISPSKLKKVKPKHNIVAPQKTAIASKPAPSLTKKTDPSTAKKVSLKSKDLEAKKITAKPKASMPKKSKVQSQPKPKGSALKKATAKGGASALNKPELPLKSKAKPTSKY